jgi:hypothetical protein
MRARITYLTSDVAYTADAKPIVGPVSNPRVEGQTRSPASAGLGTTPLVTWDLPTVGVPNLSMIDVQHIAADGSHAVVTSIFTDTTSLRIPPGVMVAGESYFLRIEALRMGTGASLKDAPLRSPFPYAWADAYSAVLQP